MPAAEIEIKRLNSHRQAGPYPWEALETPAQLLDALTALTAIAGHACRHAVLPGPGTTLGSGNDMVHGCAARGSTVPAMIKAG